jgi:hypothetical protein
LAAAFVLAIMLGSVLTGVVDDDVLSVDFMLGLDGFIAGAFVVAAGALCAPGRRLPVAIALFAIGAAIAAALFGKAVWPQAWLPFVSTLVGGATAVVGVARLAGERSIIASVAIGLVLVGVVAGVVFTRSYLDVNRGPTAVLMTRGWQRGSLLFPRTRPDLGLFYIRVVYPERTWARPFWSWTQPNGYDWETIVSADSPVPLDIEVDHGSGPSSHCAEAVDTEEARREVERLIDAYWESIARDTWIRPRRANLGSAVPIRVTAGRDCTKQ